MEPQDALSFMRSVMRLGIILGAFATAAILGCTATPVTDTDAGVIVLGCRYPSACYSTSCTCMGGSFDQLTTNSPNGCKLCDPLVQDCLCSTFDSGAMCLEPSQVCVGRAPVACPGVGARCLPAGASCSASGGIPPQVVSQTASQPDGGAPSTEPRCRFSDDVCCPGTITDAGEPPDANLDQSVND
jgi:hypothetical protein